MSKMTGCGECLSVQEVIDRLQSVKDKSVPCTVWINSQMNEPIYTGCDRIPVVHVDIVNSGTVDINCEAHEQEQIWDEVYNHIKQEKLTIVETTNYLKRLIWGYATCEELSSVEKYRLAWLKLAYKSAVKLKEQFDGTKRILKLKYDSPTVEQIIEYIQMECEDTFQEQ